MDMETAVRELARMAALAKDATAEPLLVSMAFGKFDRGEHQHWALGKADHGHLNPDAYVKDGKLALLLASVTHIDWAAILHTLEQRLNK